MDSISRSPLRNEVLELSLFRYLAEACAIVSWWRWKYNADRPHAALGSPSPVICAQCKPESLLL